MCVHVHVHMCVVHMSMCMRYAVCVMHTFIYVLCIYSCICVTKCSYVYRAAVRWGKTGKLASPGSLTPELATTYDIFPTILALANVSSGSAVLDGRDLSPILFQVDGGRGRGRSLHQCIMIYHSMAGGLKGALKDTGGVAAVRCGKYKAHFWTRSSVKPPACGQKPLPAPDGDQGGWVVWGASAGG